MALNPTKGNMYPWVDYTWNPIKGVCPTQCEYCYMRRYWPKMAPPHLDREELETDLSPIPEGVTIFVGSSIDMWAWPCVQWADAVLDRCRRHHNNTYLFQSKIPMNYSIRGDITMHGSVREMWAKRYLAEFPPHTILGTTIETNRGGVREGRAIEMSRLTGFRRMVSVEPIIDFDLKEMMRLLLLCEPEFVSIGADKQSGLSEPPKDKVLALTDALRDAGIVVREKGNLKRLLK